MAMVLFGTMDRALAQRETRALIFLPGNPHRIPPDDYGLAEFYCDEAGCDCRRVIIHVVKRGGLRTVATINYAFEPPPPEDHLPQTFLDPLNPQSELSDQLLALFENLVRHDREYAERLERHYRMFKEWVAGERRAQLRRLRAPREAGRSAGRSRRRRR